jgi:ribosomal protein S18 acetylase RimI-like enzyme
MVAYLSFQPGGCLVSIQWAESIDGLDWEELAELYLAAPLGDKKPDDLRLVFANSAFRCFARERGKLVAAGRVLADGRDCAYLCDIAVLPSHQGRGLGKSIVSRLVERSKGHRKIILYAVPGRESLYSALGFRRMRTAMAIFEDQAEAHARGYLCES